MKTTYCLHPRQFICPFNKLWISEKWTTVSVSEIQWQGIQQIRHEDTIPDVCIDILSRVCKKSLKCIAGPLQYFSTKNTMLLSVTCWHSAGRQASRQAGRQAGRQAHTHTHTHSHTHCYCRMANTANGKVYHKMLILKQTWQFCCNIVLTLNCFQFFLNRKLTINSWSKWALFNSWMRQHGVREHFMSEQSFSGIWLYLCCLFWKAGWQ